MGLEWNMVILWWQWRWRCICSWEYSGGGLLQNSRRRVKVGANQNIVTIPIIVMIVILIMVIITVIIITVIIIMVVIIMVVINMISICFMTMNYFSTGNSYPANKISGFIDDNKVIIWIYLLMTTYKVYMNIQGVFSTGPPLKSVYLQYASLNILKHYCYYSKHLWMMNIYTYPWHIHKTYLWSYVIEHIHRKDPPPFPTPKKRKIVTLSKISKTVAKRTVWSV